MVKEDKYLNYLFTLGFILLIVIFIVSIILISRVVLSEDTQLGEHVKSTKTLLEDIIQVDDIKNQTYLEKSDIFKLDFSELNVTDIAFRNVNENKSILTVFLTSEIVKENEIYYIKIKDINSLQNNNLIAYKSDGNIYIGKFRGIEDEEHVFIESELNLAGKIENSQILGLVIYKKNE